MEMLAPIDEALDTVTKQYVDDKLGGTNEVSIQNDTPVDGTELWVDWDDSPTIMVPQAGRNRIINGDISVNQRGWVAASSAGVVYPADRWIFGSNGGTCTIYNSGSVGPGLPEAAAQHLAHAVSGQSAASHFATGYQRIEDVRTLSGKQVTISFWAMADGTQSIGVELYQNFGTGGSAAVYPGTVKVQLSNVWKRYSVTITLPAVDGKTFGTDHKLVLQFYQSAGSDLAVRSGGIGIQSGTFRFWGVQLEEGPVATPFEFRSIQEMLAMCQRYFIRLVDPPARGPAGSASTLARLGFMLPVHMRIAPTVTVSGTAMVYNGANGAAISVFNAWYTTPNSVEFDATAAAAVFAASQSISLYKNGAGSSIFNIDAEVP